MDDFTPRKIVEELDKYIIGQKDAKKAVAIIAIIFFVFASSLSNNFLANRKNAIIVKANITTGKIIEE